MKEQFEILGAPFAARGARTTEWMQLVRHLWTDDTIDFHGTFFDFAGFKFYPKPAAKPAIPLWCGGKSTGVLKRVAAAADGWHPLYIDPDEMELKLKELSGYLEQNGRSLKDIQLSARPVSQATLDRSTIDRYTGLGVTLLVADTSFNHDTLQGALDEVERLADTLMPLAN
jgi:alkanesulfonate monooxygenase SsuD/methylene tetrahydromethanopterin reductase-like flavin-dependent oxidoreductase (luciferase family)